MAEYRIDITGDTSGIKAEKGVAVQAVREIGAERDKEVTKNRDRQGRFTKNVVESNNEQRGSFGAVGVAGVKSWADIHAAIGIAQGTMGAMLQVTRMVGDALEENARKQRQQTKSLTDERDRLRELATVMGQKADTDFTIKHAQYQADTGFRPDEALAFRTQFNNSGQQFSGSKINTKEYEQFEKQAGSLVAAKGFSPEDSGDFAGSVLGFKDRTKLGEGASEDALGKVNSGLAILGRGKGRNKVLINQMSMLGAASLNEDAVKGAFQDSDDVAIAVSVAAEKHDAQAAEMAKIAIRSMRDFDGKMKPLLEKAGVKRDTPFLDSIKMIAPVLADEAKAGPAGTTINDVLAKYVESREGAESIGVFVNKGASEGLIDERRQFAKGVQGGGRAIGDIAAARSDPNGPIQLRLAEAEKQQAEMRQGARDAQLATLRAQAEQELQTEGRAGTMKGWWERMDNRINTLGMGDGSRMQVDTRVSEILARRGRAAGVAFPERIQTPWMAEDAGEQQRIMIDRIQAAKGNPFSDLAKVMGEVRDEVKAMNRGSTQGTPPPLNGPPAGLPARP